MKKTIKRPLLFIFLFLFISPVAFAAPNEKPPVRKKVVKHQMTPAQIRAKRLAEWNRKHPPKRKIQKQPKTEPVNAKYLRIKRQIEWQKKNPKGTYKSRVITKKPQLSKAKPVKKNKPKIAPNKAIKPRVQQQAQRQSQLSYSTLPKFCGNSEVYHGKVNYHPQAKSFYFKHYYSKNINDFDLFKLNSIERRLLGKMIIFTGRRNATYPPGGHQTGPFQSVISNIKVMQVVSNRIDYTSIKKQCALFK